MRQAGGSDAQVVDADEAARGWVGFRLVEQLVEFGIREVASGPSRSPMRSRTASIWPRRAHVAGWDRRGIQTLVVLLLFALLSHIDDGNEKLR